MLPISSSTPARRSDVAAFLSARHVSRCVPLLFVLAACSDGGIVEPPASAVRGSHDGNRSQDRSCARHKDESEAQTQQEPSAEIAAWAAPEPREWTLQELTDSRNDEGRCDEEKKRDRNVPKEVLRKTELVE